MSFSNKDMKAPRPGKPHIQFIQCFWRVSMLMRPIAFYRTRWVPATNYVAKLNEPHIAAMSANLRRGYSAAEIRKYENDK